MRTRIGIKLRKFPSMRITVSMESAKFCPNLYRCTHQNDDSAEAHTHCTHISQKSATPPKILRFFSTKEAKKLRFRWQASQKCTFLLLSGVPEPHMPPSGGRMSGNDNIVNAGAGSLGNHVSGWLFSALQYSKVDSRQRCRNSKLSKEGLLSKQNTICILKWQQINIGSCPKTPRLAGSASART